MVPKHERSLSPMEFLHNALVLRREVTELLLRDFGVKSKVREHLTNAQMDMESRAALEDVRNRYQMDESDSQKIDSIIQNSRYDQRVLDEFPDWLINYYRTSILHVMESLCNNVYYANSIYICKNPEMEHSQRRYYLNMAVANCYQLANWMDYARQTLPVDANKYRKYLDRIDREIALLKGVREADNKRLNQIAKGKGKNKKPDTGARPKG